ncbi:hypothetical protein ACHAQA_006836 [Verticillium albo-atrum]
MPDTHYISAMSIPGLERAMMPKLVHQTKKPKTRVASKQTAMASQSTLSSSVSVASSMDTESLCKLNVSQQKAPFFERIKKRLA